MAIYGTRVDSIKSNEVIKTEKKVRGKEAEEEETARRRPHQAVDAKLDKSQGGLETARSRTKLIASSRANASAPLHKEIETEGVRGKRGPSDDQQSIVLLQRVGIERRPLRRDSQGSSPSLSKAIHWLIRFASFPYYIYQLLLCEEYPRWTAN